MQNLTPIPIIPEINDLPEILEDGPNGAMVTERVNQLVEKSFRPFNTHNDRGTRMERYVDTIAGSDDNNGLTATTAFKTIDKALDFYRTGMISWNWNTYIYVKGELQAPIDLRGICSTSIDWYTEGTLTIDKFPDESSYTISSAVDPDNYLSKQVFITEGNFVSLYLKNCVLNITTQMVFIDITIYFHSSVVVKPTSTAQWTSILFGRGVYYLQGCTYDYTNKVFGIDFNGVGCYARITGQHLFVNDQSNSGFMRIRGGATARLEFYFNNGVLSKTIYLDAANVTANAGITNLTISVDEKSEFSWHDWTKFNFCTTLAFPTLPNGRYKVWIPQRKCRLLEWKLAASAGNGTFQADTGVGYPWGDALTQSFTPAYEEITRSMNLDVPWAGAFAISLNVTNSTVPLANVLLQFNYRTY